MCQAARCLKLCPSRVQSGEWWRVLCNFAKSSTVSHSSTLTGGSSSFAEQGATGRGGVSGVDTAPLATIKESE